MNNGVSFIPIGIAIFYCYLTLKESNKLEIIRQWYELNFLESLAIIYCVLIGSIRTNWALFIAILNIGLIACLVILGWYILYNFEEIKNMVILLLRQNSILGENREVDLDSITKEELEECKEEPEECKDETEQNEQFVNEENLEFENNENNVEESFSNIDKNLETLVPEIDKIIENINVDTYKFIEYVDLDGSKSSTERPNTQHQIKSDQLFFELERITDNLVRDTKKIADNVCLVSSMMVENSTLDTKNNIPSEMPVLNVSSTNENNETPVFNVSTSLENDTPNFNVTSNQQNEMPILNETSKNVTNESPILNIDLQNPQNQLPVLNATSKYAKPPTKFATGKVYGTSLPLGTINNNNKRELKGKKIEHIPLNKI